jgi:hypothetical protein
MKKQFITMMTAFLPIIGMAQISVTEYPMKITVNIDELDMHPSIAASSPCGPVAIAFTDQLFSGGCLGTLTRTYTFSDDCGNTTTALQFILLEDTVAPVFNVTPEDISLSAGQSAVPEAPEVTASDNSKNEVNVTFHQFNTGGTITRTWTAEDDCGNIEVMRQVITLK